MPAFKLQPLQPGLRTKEEAARGMAHELFALRDVLANLKLLAKAYRGNGTFHAIRSDVGALLLRTHALAMKVRAVLESEDLKGEGQA